MTRARLRSYRHLALLLAMSLTAPLPAAMVAEAQQALPAAPASPTSSQPANPPQPQKQQGAQAAPQTAKPPVAGVAAAPVVRSDGVPASEPSGAAIAPAKQKRKFSLALRVGLIVGAAIAVGSVTAASLASPSRPHTTP